ncbi:MAG TPA: protein kinase, partial [Bryobacteraceae bacterium]
VVHRDIKPGNILVRRDGSVKLTDFGLARFVTGPRLTQSGTFAGSPLYVSPEQALGTGAVDARTDVYSCGVVLYELVTGRLPFTGESAFALISAHRSVAPRPPAEWNPGIGSGLNRVILRALEKDPDRRFASAAEFHTALERALKPEIVVVRTPPGTPRFRNWTFAAAGIFTLLATGAGYAVFRHHPYLGNVSVRDFLPQSVSDPVAPVAPPTFTPEPPRLPEPNLNAAEPTAPPRLAVGRSRRVVPPKTGLRITGSEAPEPAPRARPKPKEFRPPEAPAASAETRAPAPVPAQVAAPVTQPDSAKAAAPKKRNPVVRALLWVFRTRRESTDSATSPLQP